MTATNHRLGALRTKAAMHSIGLAPSTDEKRETIYIVSRWFISLAVPHLDSAEKAINFLIGPQYD